MGEKELMYFSPNLLITKISGYYEKVERQELNEWARARLISFYAIKGHDSKNQLKNPSSLFSLPGDRVEVKKLDKKIRADIWAKIDEKEAINGTE